MTGAKMRFQVRGYELGAERVVTLPNLSRYGELLRRDALGERQALGEKLGRAVVRAETVEVVEPVRYGEVLDCETWAARVGRTSLDIVHRIDCGGAPRVRMRATLVRISREFVPRPVPEGWVATPGHEAVDLEAFAFPKTAPPPSFVYDFMPRPSDEDLLRHVNHAGYFAFAFDAHRAAIRAKACPPSSLAGLTVSFEGELHAFEPSAIHLAFGDAGEVFGTLEKKTDGALITRFSGRLGPDIADSL